MKLLLNKVIFGCYCFCLSVQVISAQVPPPQYFMRSTSVYINSSSVPISSAPMGATPRRAPGDPDPFGGLTGEGTILPSDPGDIYDPFGGMTGEGTILPDDPGQSVPIGGCPVVLMLLLAGMYAYCKRSSHSCNSEQKI